MARSDLHQLVFPATQADLLAVDQSGFPVGVRMGGLEVILALAGFAAACLLYTSQGIEIVDTKDGASWKRV